MWNGKTRVFSCPEGALYGISKSGSLVWYRHLDWETGGARFSNQGNQVVVSDDPRWGTYVDIVSGGHGVLYGITPTGSLVWYRHLDWETGGSRFANSGQPISLATGQNPGDGWSGFQQVVAGGQGVLYGITPTGSLVWYRHLDWETGGPRFDNGGTERRLATGQNPGDGWSGFQQVVAGGQGVLYGITPTGSLVWYRHLDWETGGPRFDNGGTERRLATGQNPGDGWSGFQQVVAGGQGVLYGITPTGSLVWYRHLDWETGGPRFDNGGSERRLATGQNPGDGWSGFQPIGQDFTFDDRFTLDQRELTLERHRFAYGRVRECQSITESNKSELFAKYERPLRHGITTRPKAIASAPRNGENININLTNFFRVNWPDRERSQTLIHEMMHLIGEDHPDKDDPDTDLNDYFATPPLQAELCIAGQQSDTLCGVTDEGCTIMKGG